MNQISENLQNKFKSKKEGSNALSYMDKMRAQSSKETKSLKQISNLIVKMQMYRVNHEDDGRSMTKIADNIHKMPHVFIKMPTNSMYVLKTQK